MYKGKLALQVMFMEENKKFAKEIAKVIREINPDEIQINTPLRPCGVKPLPKKEIDKIKEYFKGLNTVSVYEALKKDIKPISDKDTLIRRGKI
jgi:wyosine [tRNA(Phe)-imidazoG37] synthetase (radical SAM superfamily)